MSNINDFISTFKKEVSRPSNFNVQIFPTSVDLLSALSIAAAKGGKDPSQFFRSIPMSCEAAELPSRTFNLIQQKTYGPIKQFPIQTTYSLITLTFICSDDMFEKWIFDSWMNYISNASFFPMPSSLGDIVDLFTDGLPVNYDFEYKNKYEAFILITQFDNKNDPSLYSGLFHAFPVSINELPLSWSATDSIHRLAVTFAYTYHNTAKSIGGFPMI